MQNLRAAIRSPRSLIAIAVFILFSIIYSLTMYPEVGPGDSGEVMTAAHTLSVPHAPGFPLYVLLGWLWSHLVPIGMVAWRLNLFSAFLAAGSAAITAWACVGVLETLGLSRRDAVVAALIAGVALGAGHTLWHWSGIGEVYSLNTLLVAILAAFIFPLRPPRTSHFILGGLLFGLGLSVHYANTLFVAPLLLMGLWTSSASAEPTVAETARQSKGQKRRRQARPAANRARRWRIMLRGALMGLSATLLVVIIMFGTLIVLADRDKEPNWGHTDSIERLWLHMSGKQYSVNLNMPDSSEEFRQRVGSAFGLWFFEFTPLGWLLAVLGWIVLLRRRRAWALGIAGTVFLTFLYHTIYFIDVQDRESYNLPLYVLTALLIGVGLWQAVSFIARRQPKLKIGRQLTAIAVVTLLLIPWQWSDADHSRHTFHRDYVFNSLEGLPQRSIVFTEEFELYSPAMYYQVVEGRWPNVILLDMLLWKDRPWYVENLLHRHPELEKRLRAQADRFLVELYKFERDELKDSRDIAQHYKDLLQRMRNIDGFDLFLDTRAMRHFVSYGGEMRTADVPEGMLFRQYGEIAPGDLDELDWQLDALLDGDLRAEPTEIIIAQNHVAMLRNRAQFLRNYQRTEKVEAALDLARRIEEAHLRDIPDAARGSRSGSQH